LSHPLALLRLGVTLLILMQCGLTGYGQRTAVLDRQELIAQARKAYYNGKSLGLAEFSCEVKPDWTPVLAKLPSNPEAQKVIDAQHFRIQMSERDEFKLTTRTEFFGQKYDPEIAKAYSGMKELTTEFFAMWTTFMLRNPLPYLDGPCQVNTYEGGYRISCQDPSTAVVVLLREDFAITEIKANTPKISAVIRPQFQKTTGGFILVGYDSDYRPTSGVGKTKRHVEIRYESRLDFQLPSGMKMDGQIDDQAVKLDVAFVDYNVTKRK